MAVKQKSDNSINIKCFCWVHHSTETAMFKFDTAKVTDFVCKTINKKQHYFQFKNTIKKIKMYRYRNTMERERSPGRRWE